MSKLKMRMPHKKVYKIFIFLIIAFLVPWNVFIIFKECTTSKYNIPLRYRDDNCDMNTIESGWFLNPNGNLDLDPDESRIFFHATSCRRGLTSRQACAVESTARANPDWRIQVIFVGNLDSYFKEGYLYKALQTLENVEFSSIDLIRYIQGTPLEILNLEQIVQMTQKHNLADLLKYLTLYKFGGVYMDMDFIVGNSFDGLGKNWAGKPLDDRLGADVLSFSNDVLGRTIANATILEILRQHNPLSGDRGVIALIRALENICSTKNIINMSAATCQGFKFHGQSIFYPVTHNDVATFFLPIKPETINKLTVLFNVRAHRLWTEFTGISKYPNNSLLFSLASKYCPIVYKLYGDDFGV